MSFYDAYSCATITIIQFKILFSPPKILFAVTLQPTPTALPLPQLDQQLLIYFLSLQICLFWKFHIAEIIQLEALCIWLLFVNSFFEVHPYFRVFQYEFLLISEKYYTVSIYCILFIHFQQTDIELFMIFGYCE